MANEAAARDAGIDRALGGSPVAWQVDAVNAVKLVAEQHGYFCADDVWDQLLVVGARTPPNLGALSGILRQCAAKGRAWIEPTDRSQMSERDGRHKSRIMVWRSLICGSRTPEALAWGDVFKPTTPAQRREADQGRHRR